MQFAFADCILSVNLLLIFSVYNRDIEFHAEFAVVTFFDGNFSRRFVFDNFSELAARDKPADVETVFFFVFEIRLKVRDVCLIDETDVVQRLHIPVVNVNFDLFAVENKTYAFELLFRVFVNDVVFVFFFYLAHFKSVVFIYVSEFYALLNFLVENTLYFYAFFVVFIRSRNRRRAIENDFVWSVNQFSAALDANSGKYIVLICGRRKFEDLFFGFFSRFFLFGGFRFFGCRFFDRFRFGFFDFLCFDFFSRFFDFPDFRFFGLR